MQTCQPTLGSTTHKRKQKHKTRGREDFCPPPPTDTLFAKCYTKYCTEKMFVFDAVDQRPPRKKTKEQYFTFAPGCSLSIRMMAISATAVFPDPVGAPRSTLSSLWYSTWNSCVWMGLKCWYLVLVCRGRGVVACFG